VGSRGQANALVLGLDSIIVKLRHGGPFVLLVEVIDLGFMLARVQVFQRVLILLKKPLGLVKYEVTEHIEAVAGVDLFLFKKFCDFDYAPTNIFQFPFVTTSYLFKGLDLV
jgi:hypothetical protein